MASQILINLNTSVFFRLLFMNFNTVLRFHRRELKNIASIIKEHEEKIIDKWNEYFVK